MSNSDTALPPSSASASSEMTQLSAEQRSKILSEHLPKQLSQVQQQLKQYPQSARILAASKQQNANTLRQAFSLGQQAFGENYLKEALQKMQQLQDLAIEWHFIGPIQSNKCKAIAENFSWVQSIDRIKVAEKLSQHCPPEKTLQICIQVNSDNESTKAGIKAEDLESFCLTLANFKNLNLRGIMAIPQAEKSISEQSESFAKLSQQFNTLKNTFPQLDTLSIGMSNDYLTALENGSTLIRLGTQLFGARPAKP